MVVLSGRRPVHAGMVGARCLHALETSLGQFVGEVIQVVLPITCVTRCQFCCMKKKKRDDNTAHGLFGLTGTLTMS